jgi:hypothetical protein
LVWYVSSNMLVSGNLGGDRLWECSLQLNWWKNQIFLNQAFYGVAFSLIISTLTAYIYSDIF